MKTGKKTLSRQSMIKISVQRNLPINTTQNLISKQEVIREESGTRQNNNENNFVAVNLTKCFITYPKIISPLLVNSLDNYKFFCGQQRLYVSFITFNQMLNHVQRLFKMIKSTCTQDHFSFFMSLFLDFRLLLRKDSCMIKSSQLLTNTRVLKFLHQIESLLSLEEEIFRKQIQNILSRVILCSSKVEISYHVTWLSCMRGQLV